MSAWGSRSFIVPFSPGLSPIPVLIERFFVKFALAWSPESVALPPADAWSVSRIWRSGERFSTSMARYFAPERSNESPFLGTNLIPPSHSGVYILSLASPTLPNDMSAPFTVSTPPGASTGVSAQTSIAAAAAAVRMNTRFIVSPPFSRFRFCEVLKVPQGSSSPHRTAVHPLRVQPARCRLNAAE